MASPARIKGLSDKYNEWDKLPFDAFYKKELGKASLLDQKEIIDELKHWLEQFIEYGHQLSDQSLQQVNQAYGSFSGFITNVSKQADGQYVNQTSEHY